MIFPLRSKALAFLGFAACLVFTSCDDKDDAAPKYSVPTTYNFENVNYSGQQNRIAMLGELDTYIKTGNTGARLEAQTMKNMYANASNPFTTAGLNESGVQLKNKTNPAAQAAFEGLFDAVAQASLSLGAPAVPGVSAGLLTSGDKSYLVDQNGVELQQVISKGLMGAVFYFQVVEGYLSPAKIGSGVDNTTIEPGKGTTMEHHWDEAFGYFGAPKDFPTNLNDTKYWAGYSKQVDQAIKSNEKLMNAYLKGRAAITAKDMAAKDAAVVELRSEWEKLVAAAAIHELNAAKTNIGDQAKKSHYLSEALGFLMSTQNKADRKLNAEKYQQVLAKLGDNFYDTKGEDVAAAIDLLSSVYELDSVKAGL
jgi:hypothetical protein